METNNQVQINSPAPSGDQEKKVQYWAVIAAVLLILAGSYFLFTQKNKSKKVEYKIPGNTLADVAFANFPTELVLDGATPPKYFDNKTNTGAWFIVKQTVDQIKESYTKKLAGTSWKILPVPSGSPTAYIYLQNKDTKVNARISFDVLTDKATVITVGVYK